MQIELTEKEFRRLLDMAYIGNWILNSTRGSDRFEDYDKVESRLFSYCKDHGMASLTETWNGQPVPSRAFAEGGIHEAIMDYEDAVFFDILAEGAGPPGIRTMPPSPIRTTMSSSSAWTNTWRNSSATEPTACR